MPITAAQFAHELSGARGRLLQQREAKRERFLRDGLLGDDGEIQIASETFHPADILATMATETYRITRAESDEKFWEETADRVLARYPSPIALAFNGFLYGSKQPLARLHFMRDTWEAAVSVVFGLAISEYVQRNYKLSEVLIRDGPNNAPRSMKASDLFSDRIAVRLGCVEGLLLNARVMGLSLSTADLIPVEVIDEMRRLNDLRNGFSHEQTKSEKQADEIIEECKPDLLDVLSDLEGLREARLFRLHGISNHTANTLEV